MPTQDTETGISIHALREEGDRPQSALPLQFLYFYPRPPRGGRRLRVMSRRGTWLFLSTPSARRATSGSMSVKPLHLISIHALREEGDLFTQICEDRIVISIHALREEGDSKNRDKISIFKQIIQHSARI